MTADKNGWVKASEELPPTYRKVEIQLMREGFKPFRVFACYIHRYEVLAENFFDMDELDEDNFGYSVEVGEDGKEYVKPMWFERISTHDELAYWAIDDFYTVTHWRHLTEGPANTNAKVEKELDQLIGDGVNTVEYYSGLTKPTLESAVRILVQSGWRPTHENR